MNRQQQFIKELFLNEGFYSNDKYDKGGKTYLGISKRSFPREFKVIKDLVKDNKLSTAKDYARRFYGREFYNPLYNKIEDVSLAFKVFDFGVNAGKKRAVKHLQKVINKYNRFLNCRKIKVDGIFGRVTLINTNLYSQRFVKYFPKVEPIQSETEFYTLYVMRLEKYYRSLWNFFRFGKGWLKRLKRVFN